MELHCAMFLRTLNHNLEKKPYLRALGGFLVSCVELGMSVFSKWRVIKVSISNSPKNRGETGIFAEEDVEIKNTGQQN